MNYIIIKKYKTNEEDKAKYNLECNERVLVYDYVNKLFTNFGIQAKYTNFKEILKHNKHRFIFSRRLKNEKY